MKRTSVRGAGSPSTSKKRNTMSFLSVLKTIGQDVVKGLTVAEPFVAVAASFIPGGSIAATVLNSVVAAEQLVTTANSGTQKKAIVMSIINTVQPGLNQTSVSSAVDSIVAALNLLATATTPAPVAPA